MKTETELEKEGINLYLTRSAANKLAAKIDFTANEAEKAFLLCREDGHVPAFVETNLAFWVDLQSTLKTLLEK
jgi:hypothetical protein